MKRKSRPVRVSALPPPKTAAERLDIITIKYAMTVPEWAVFASANYWPTQGLARQHLLDLAVAGSEGDDLGLVTLQEAETALECLYDQKYLKLRYGNVVPTRKGRSVFLRLRRELFPGRFK